MHPNVSAACGVVLDSSQLKTKESGSIFDGSPQRIILLTVPSPTMSGLELGIQGKLQLCHQRLALMLYLVVALMVGVTRRSHVSEIGIWRAKELFKDSAVSEQLIQTELLLQSELYQPIGALQSSNADMAASLR